MAKHVCFTITHEIQIEFLSKYFKEKIAFFIYFSVGYSLKNTNKNLLRYSFKYLSVHTFVLPSVCLLCLSHKRMVYMTLFTKIYIELLSQIKSNFVK